MFQSNYKGVKYTAYLIIICDLETNAILDCQIWSSPEWEQSRRLPQPTYIAYQAHSYVSFQDANNHLLEWIKDNPRYNRLLKYAKNPL